MAGEHLSLRRVEGAVEQAGAAQQRLCAQLGFEGGFGSALGGSPAHPLVFFLSVAFPDPAFELFSPWAVPLVLREGQAGLCALGASFSCMNSHIYAY